jgi:hypothetical protein
MNTLAIELPVDGLPSAAELPAKLPDEARFLLAVKLFEQGQQNWTFIKLSLDRGKAAGHPGLRLS